ncbi:MAG: YebC/PmpR family DNA-binding transcriptional regulator [Candidatus Doudnabacteria bacterium]|nr:YebC/PmpR family DNA-binding transcriptional regulator [Candidatus Doudnabacteria bacterium]
MSGHSKWSTIKRKKGAADAKRGQIFTRHARMITLAAKQGGGNPEMNFALRLAIDNARNVNMPNDTIERAIKKGAGEGGADSVQSVVYEAYGPANVAFLIEGVTDNTNRTLTDVKQALTKNGGSLGQGGTVAWQFARRGVLSFPTSAKKDDLELALIEAGADEIEVQADMVVVYTAPDSLQEVQKALSEASVEVEDSEITMLPNDPVEVSEDDQRRVNQLVEALEEVDDVVSVTTTMSA